MNSRGPYVGTTVVNDADSHLLETSNWLIDHLDDDLVGRIEPLWMRGLGEFAERVVTEVDDLFADPAGREILDQQLLERKNWWALGATRPAQRSRALDRLGFSHQLVFSTHASRTLLFPIGQPVEPGRPGPPAPPTDLDIAYGLVRAHNRAMAAFCRDDDRLHGVAWMRLDDPALAIAATREALESGCRAVEIPSGLVGEASPTHVELEPFYALLEEAGVPLLFHLGSGGQLPDPRFGRTGREHAPDPAGNADPLRRLRVVALAGPVEVALAALIFDGVLERHPGLRVGVIEQGATWVPGFLRTIDTAVALDSVMRVSERRPEDLPMAPSEYVLRQVRFTPFPLEPLEWIIQQSDPSLYLFSSDYPHAEGGSDPFGQFQAQLGALSAEVRDAFFRTNYETLMGR